MALKATLKDVARLSGVSIGTVDRVLHERGRVSEENKIAVMQAVKTLHYSPSQIARALVKHRRNICIGISFMDASHEFWQESLTGVKFARASLAPFGVEVIIDHCVEYTSIEQKASIKRLLSKGADGILLTPIEESINWIDDVIPETVPYGTVLDDIQSKRKLFHVGPDDCAMGALIARLGLLYTKGEMCAAILAPNAHVCGTQNRILGFQKMLKQNMQEKDLLFIFEIPGDSEKGTNDEIYSTTERIVSDHPEVNMLYVTNGSAQWVAAAIKNAGVSRKIFVFGHEYTEMTESFLKSGGITATLYQKPGQQWNMAVHMLNNYLMEGKKPALENQTTECLILMAETLPLVKIGIISP
jgi:LacI family transcriptional regulator